MFTAQKPMQYALGEISRLRGKALEVFLEKLQEQEGENLLRVVLFGSVARGDSEPDSDMDVFVLVKNGTRWELMERIVDIAMDINLEAGESKVYISPFINRSKYRYRTRPLSLRPFLSHIPLKCQSIPVFLLPDSKSTFQFINTIIFKINTERFTNDFGSRRFSHGLYLIKHTQILRRKVNDDATHKNLLAMIYVVYIIQLYGWIR
jgi:predicted nucleotidyltransferase